MARSRKTIDVNLLIDYANTQLARTDELEDISFKVGVIVMLEHILIRTNNYRGFYFLDNDDTKVNTLGYYSRRYFKKP